MAISRRLRCKGNSDLAAALAKQDRRRACVLPRRIVVNPLTDKGAIVGIVCRQGPASWAVEVHPEGVAEVLGVELHGVWHRNKVPCEKAAMTDAERGGPTQNLVYAMVAVA